MIEQLTKVLQTDQEMLPVHINFQYKKLFKEHTKTRDSRLDFLKNKDM